MFVKLNPECLVIRNKTRDKIIIHSLLQEKSYYFNDDYAIIINMIEDNKTIKLMLTYDFDKTRDVVRFLIKNNLGLLFIKNVALKKITRVLPTFILEREFRLDTAVLELTGECNLNCIFCMENNMVYRSCGCKKWPNNKNMPISNWINIIKQIRDLGVSHIVFSGGEPFIRWKEMQILLEHIGKNILIDIYTNGTLLNRSIIGALSNYKNLQLTIQTYGSNERIHDEISQVKGSFSSLEANIDILKEYNIIYRRLYFITKVNVDAIDKHKTNGREIYEYLYPNHAYSAINNKMDRLNKTSNYNVDNYLLKYNLNPCFYRRLFISNDGTVYPCMMLRDFPLGDSSSIDLWKIIRFSSYKKFWELSNIKLHPCCECEKKIICLPCIAVNYSDSKVLNKIHYCERAY